MNKHTTTQQNKVLHVIGYAWQGLKTESDYRLKGHEPLDMIEALSLAVGFQSLDSAEVISTITYNFSSARQLA
jgi:hypothetical protein